jgi:hypothetical protein
LTNSFITSVITFHCSARHTTLLVRLRHINRIGVSASNQYGSLETLPATWAGLCYGRVARHAPMTVGKKMNRIGGQRVVEIDAEAGC